MVRTIQHPGVEIQETEIGSYRSTVVMNNAYIMGYADRGPIYDYSWITTTKEFTKIYGEPQTEAEKYLFIAVQSVLQNGGTPIVARMPYDNKQCKAYKAMKLTWADVNPAVNTRLESPLVPLDEVAARVDSFRNFDEILTTESVTKGGKNITQDYVNSLTVDQLLMQLNPYEKGSELSNGKLYDKFDEGFKLNGVYPSGLGVDQAAVTSMLQSVKKDQQQVNRIFYKYDEGCNIVQYQDLSGAFKNGFADSNDEWLQLSDRYLSANYINKDGVNTSVLINIFDTCPFGGEDIDGVQCFNRSNIPANIVRELSAIFKNSAFSETTRGDSYSYDFMRLYPESDVNLNCKLTLVSSVYNSEQNKFDYTDCWDYDALSSFLDKAEYEKKNPTTDKFMYAFAIKAGNPVAYIADTDVSSYLVRPSIIFNDELYDGYSLYENLPASITGYVKVKADEEVLEPGQLEQIYGQDFTATGDFTVNGLLQANAIDSEEPSEDSTIISKTFEINPLIPVYSNTYNGYIVKFEYEPELGTVSSAIISNDFVSYANLSAAAAADPNAEYKLIGFINGDDDVPAISGMIKLSAIANSGQLYGTFTGDEEFPVVSLANADRNGRIPRLEEELKTVVGETTLGGKNDQGEEKHFTVYEKVRGDYEYSEFNYDINKFLFKGDVEVADFGLKVAYTTSLLGKPVISLTDNDYLNNEQLVWLRTIYNNPYFLRMSDENYTALEAELLTTPEMGFKYGLYLDSEDCEISNNQYDDLVTVNQFTAVDRAIDKYGQDIDDANFVIVDKQKTVVQGVGGNIGYFTVVIDPFDALKVQRLLVNPEEKNAASRMIKDKEFEFKHTAANQHRLDYWAYESADAWNKIYDDLLDSMDCLQRVRNADGIYIGEPNPITGEKPNILDSWSIPLTGGYYDESISKILMKKFPGISMASISADDFLDGEKQPSIIDHNYATHVTVAVCKTTIDPSNGKIVVNLVETFFGSLFNEKNAQNGRSLFIGDIINANSDFIEFYRNDYVSSGDKGAYDPPEYRRTEVNQIFIRDTDELKNAAQLRGIDYEDYGCDALDPAVKAENEKQYYEDLEKFHIYAIDKKEVCIYNLHWEANLTSFSKKESQKIIANTTGLYSVADGKTVNIANNFLIDMDRCIKFIKNIDDIPLHFICDAGLSTIAQFCDNVVFNPRKKSVVGEQRDPVTGKKNGVKIYETTGGWITQPFDPDNDPDGDDRYITGYEDVATWRKVVEKITEIAGEIRKDCFAIIDAPRQLTLDGAAPKIRRSKYTNNFDKTIGRALRYISGINSSYVAGYYNWLRTTDQYSGKSIWIPPTSKIIGNYCYLNINNLPWLAPAGLTYGLINGCHAISHNPDYQEEDQIYMKSWNYIKQYPMEGLVVEGQRTLLGKESVFERVNVRLLFLDLERFAYNVSKSFKYQVNNAYTREQFVQTLKPKFEDYTLRGGIYEYFIKCDSENNTPETIDANELRGDIFIKPARLIEFILLNFVGTTTGTDFTELQLG